MWSVCLGWTEYLDQVTNLIPLIKWVCDSVLFDSSGKIKTTNQTNPCGWVKNLPKHIKTKHYFLKFLILIGSICNLFWVSLILNTFNK